MLRDPGYKFCPKCGTGFIKKRLKEFEPERLVCPQCSFIFYLNPKVAAGAVVDYDGRIVLLRREIDPRAGFWVHPGGFVDRGETLEAAARRETREEVGLDVEIGRLLGAYSFEASEVVVVTFAARAVGGTPVVGDESLEVRLFEPHELPWDRLAFPSTELALNEYVRTTGISAPRVVRETAPPSDSRIAALRDASRAAHESRDARAASLVYPALIRLLRDSRRFREALTAAEEGLALTQDPMIARLADEVAHEMAEAEQERC